MIESITNGCATGAEILYQAPAGTLAKLNALTLERNTVLVARVSKDSDYGIDELRTLREALKCIFPNHEVFVWYDDLEFMAIHDKGYTAPSLEGINATSNYY